ncbi:MAG: MBL fold metallo-hydrolase [Vampirovibrionales bacterium]|nr:MBL fold metallo-hydrolase [Vampirovibrionales bacterium]
MLKLKIYTLGAFQVHTYLVWNPQTRSAILIDSGEAPDAALETLTQENLTLKALVYTHVHIDHVQGQSVILDKYPDCPVYMHPEASFWLEKLPQQAAAYRLKLTGPVIQGQALNHGDELTFDGIRLQARYCPGHSPCSLTLYLPDATPEAGWAFVGDVIFAGAVGRTDFPRGDWLTLKHSIETQVYTLPPQTRLFCGHGQPTTVGHERATNPYVRLD